MKLGTVVLRFTVTTALWTFLSLTYLPLHEYGHCAASWGQGDQTSCSVVYYHPTAQQPPSWQCREENQWGPNGTIIGRVLLCNQNTTNDHSDADGFARTQHSGQWYEHPILYGVLPMIYVAAILPFWAWSMHGIREYRNQSRRGAAPVSR